MGSVGDAADEGNGSEHDEYGDEEVFSYRPTT
jgi:hypothetical protein